MRVIRTGVGGGEEGRRAEGRITFCSIKRIPSQSSDLFNGQVKYYLKIYALYMYPLSYFICQPVLHDWCNKGHGMCYLVCGMN